MANIEILDLLNSIGDRERRIAASLTSRGMSFELHRGYVNDLLNEFHKFRNGKGDFERIAGIIAMIRGECFHAFKHVINEEVEERVWLWHNYDSFNQLESHYTKIYNLFQSDLLEDSKVKLWLKEGLRKDLTVDFKKLLDDFDEKIKWQKEFLDRENELFEKVLDLKFAEKNLKDLSEQLYNLPVQLTQFEKILLEEKRLLEGFDQFRVFNGSYQLSYMDIYYDLKSLKDPEDIVLYVSDLMEMKDLFDKQIVMFLQEITGVREFGADLPSKVNSGLVDLVSGCLSRNLFDIWVNLEARDGYSIIVIDIDGLDDILKDFGDKNAEWVVRDIGKCIRDEISMNKAFRYGRGFVVLVEGDSTGAAGLGEKIRKGVEGVMFKFDKRVIKTTVSIGVAAYRKSVKKMLSDGAEALYNAKTSGMNRVEIFK